MIKESLLQEHQRKRNLSERVSGRVDGLVLLKNVDDERRLLSWRAF